MPATRRVRVVFTGASPAPDEEEDGAGQVLLLRFRAERRRLDIDEIVDWAPTGPELDLPTVTGLGKVVRILRAARIAVPGPVEELVGRGTLLLELLERAEGTALSVELRPRSRVRFTAWTENGIEEVDDVSEVLEAPDAFLVLRQKGRFPVRVPRDEVVRQQTDCERWYEVVEIERA